MSAKKLILIVAVAATTGVYAKQRHDYTDVTRDALPAAEGIEIPQIVITAKREHGAE